MFYYLYKITNNINGKIYVGVHKTEDMNDGYMGSGKVIKRAIEKHGVDNFTKTILETFDNPEDMFEREKEVVTEEFIARDDVYNLRRGGSGGFDYINRNGMSVNTLEDPEIRKRTFETQRKLGLGVMYNEDARLRGVEAAKAVVSGTIWINNGKEQRRVPPNIPIPDGWVRGNIQKRK